MRPPSLGAEEASLELTPDNGHPHFPLQGMAKETAVGMHLWVEKTYFKKKNVGYRSHH